MEISISTSRNNSDSAHRAIYILSCLGSNIKYSSFGGPISRPLVLRARQGFKEQIRSLRSAFASGCLREESVALICCASLFESMTSGYSSGLEVIEEACPFSGSSSSLFCSGSIWMISFQTIMFFCSCVKWLYFIILSFYKMAIILVILLLATSICQCQLLLVETAAEATT